MQQGYDSSNNQTIQLAGCGRTLRELYIDYILVLLLYFGKEFYGIVIHNEKILHKCHDTYIMCCSSVVVFILKCMSKDQLLFCFFKSRLVFSEHFHTHSAKGTQWIGTKQLCILKKTTYQ